VPRAVVLRGAVSVAVLCLAPSVSLAAESPWRVEKGEVRVTVPLKPGGAFDATSSALGGKLTPGGAHPVRLSGEIALDLATLDTGIGLRNQHLREKYLEIAKGRDFDRAVISDVAVNDAGGPDFQGRSAFGGNLLLHGVSRPIAGTVEIRRAGAGVRIDASFPLTLTDFAIVPPEYLGVGVANKVMVKVQLSLVPAQGVAP
jgi:polyisoprenoid-binding protein YceI